MMATGRADLIELKKAFSKVNTKDINSLKRWFDEHPYLTTNDHAQIASVTIYTIRKWMKQLCRSKPRPKFIPTRTMVRKVSSVVVPENWRTAEWLTIQLRSHSPKHIADAVGLHRTRLLKICAAKNVKTPGKHESTNNSTNPNHTREWCYHHYVELGLTQSQCGKKAGIGRQAFRQWLNHFEIPVRAAYDNNSRHLKPLAWVRKFKYRAKKYKVIRKIRTCQKRLYIRYYSRVYENYWFDTTKMRYIKKNGYVINEAMAKLENVPPVVHEFESELDGTNRYPAHILINRKLFNDASFMEQRVAINQFIKEIVLRGWKWPTYPDRIINNEWQRLLNSDPSRFIMHSMFQRIERTPSRIENPGRRILSHFFDLSEWHSVLKRPWFTWRYTNLLAKTHFKFSFHNLLRIAMAVYKPRRWDKQYYAKFQDTSVYIAILKQFKATGEVLDLVPGIGNRALACAALKLNYTNILDQRFQTAINRGFGAFTNLKYAPYDGRTVDLLIYDDPNRAPNIEWALSFANRAKQMMIYIPYTDTERVKTLYQPASMIPISVHGTRHKPDNLFVY